MEQKHKCLYRISYKESDTKKYNEVSGTHLIVDATNAYITVNEEKKRIERCNIVNIEHICQH